MFADAQNRPHRAALWVAVIVFASVLILFLMGRGFWCPQGDTAVVSLDADGPHLSQHLFDPYSLTHVEHGILFFAAVTLLFKRARLSTRFVIAMFLECAWEVVENSSWLIHTFRKDSLAQGYVGDSIANSLADMACAALGFWLASRVRWYWSVVFFVAVEVVLYVLIGDNLLRNMLLPVWPKAP